MSELGQTRKYSPRAHVFRSAPNNGHMATTAACPFGANNGSGRTHASQSVANALVPRCTDAEEQMSASEERLNYNK